MCRASRMGIVLCVLGSVLLASTGVGSALGGDPPDLLANAIDPLEPYEYRTFGPAGPVTIDAQGDLLAVGYSTNYTGEGSFDGLGLYDISDRDMPTLLGMVHTGSQPWHLRLDGAVLYTAESAGFRSWDISDPASPTLMGTGTMPSATAISIEGTVAYVGEWNGTVSSVDISDPTSMTTLDSTTVAGNITALDGSGDLLAVSSRNGGGCTLFDVSQPATIGVHDVVGIDSYGIAIKGDYLFAATWGASFASMDISNPGNIKVRDATLIGNGAWAQQVSGGVAYVATWGHEVVLCDISNPLNLNQDRMLPLPDRAWEIVARGDYVYGATGPLGVTIVRGPDDVAGTAIERGVAGDDRYETAVLASQQAFPEGAETVLVATGANWPDALGGSALAGAVQGPILLSAPTALPAPVLAEIRRLGASKAVILGGTAAVGTAVESALASELGALNVRRLGGADRYTTAELVAVEVSKTVGYTSERKAFVATGQNFPDAIAASPLSAANAWPLFLVGPDGLDADTIQLMRDMDVDEVVILGGTAVVSVAVESDIEDVWGEYVVRLAGTDRYSTGVAVAEYGVSDGHLFWDGVAIATGTNFPDALTGGVLQGRMSSVMLLTDGSSLSWPTAVALDTHGDRIGLVRYLGGPAAVSAVVRGAVAGLLQ